MKVNKRIMILMIFIIFSLVITGCNNKNKEDNIKNSSNEEILESIRLEGGRDWGMSNPFLQDPRGPGTSKVKLMFDSLLEEDEKGIIPWLGTDWSVKDNIYSFKINENAKFHDGKPLTTEDIAFTIDYYEENSPINNVLKNENEFIINEYKIIDDHNIEFIVNNPTATTLKQIGSFLILPKHIWKDVNDPYTYIEEDAFIGSGPYMWGDYDSASGSYEFIGNMDYHGLRPAAKRVFFVPVSDSILAFENNEIDITAVPADLISRYEDDNNIEMITKDNDMGYKLLINMERIPEFKDVNLRKGLYKGINRKEIIEKVFRGLGEVGSPGYVPSTNHFYNPEVEKYSYNLDDAQEIFKDTDIKINLLTSNLDKDIKISELIKNDLESIGININVLSMDGKLRDEKIFSEEYDFALVGNGGWGRSPDYLRTLFSDISKFSIRNPHGMGPIGYSNDKITNLTENQLLELDNNKREDLFKEIQLEISKEVPVIVIGTESSKVMFRKNGWTGWTKTYDYQQIEQNRLSYVQDN